MLSVIDISALFSHDEEAIAALVEEWDRTLQKVGFAVIVGHNVQEDIRMNLYKEARSFFELPLEEKLKAKVSNVYGSGGYQDRGKSF